MGLPVSLDDIRAAAEISKGKVVRTPTIRSGPLSDLVGAEVYLKLETLQRTGSFKDRGALVKLESLSEEERARGVVAMSAGNHAQGVAYHAQRLGIPATIVMPEGTPFTKIARTQAFGARVVQHGDTVDAAREEADRLAAEEALVFVHPYADEKIIAGQGVIGLELLEDLPNPDYVLVPIGGGGIIGGIATAVKALTKRTKIVGVEASLYPSMYQILNGLEPRMGGDTIADGIAVKTPGEINIAIARKLVDEILLVDEIDLELGVQTMLETGRVLAEGAGAAPLAALLANKDRFQGKTVVLIVCGSNIDSRLLSSVLMRGMAKAGRLVRLRIQIQDRPGILAKIATQIGAVGGNIVEVAHQRMFFDVPVKQADVDIVVETRDAAHVREVQARLKAAGLPCQVLSNLAVDGG